MTVFLKEKDQNSVENYCPVSILPNLLMIYERYLYHQMYKYFSHILSKWQYGFCKGFSMQHCLNKKMVEMFAKLPTVLATSIKVSKNHGVFFPIDNKEWKLIMPLVVPWKFYMEFRKGPFWVPYISISFSRVFQIVVRSGGGIRNFAGRIFDQPKLKIAFCEYWTLIKTKMTCLSKANEIKTKMVYEQWL